MIRIRIAGRLHFGLLSVATTDFPHRLFGGAGMMVDLGTSVLLRADRAWRADGETARRSLTFAERFLTRCPDRDAVARVRPQCTSIDGDLREHVGLGAGTQLALAVAKGLAHLAGDAEASSVDLARSVGRGERSAIGIHGFDRGGFLVDAGRKSADAVAPLILRLRVPDEWRVVLCIPRDRRGLHGIEERRAFDSLRQSGIAGAVTDRLCRLVLMGMIPAIKENDLATFGDAVAELNARVGETFAAHQGGTYCSARTRETIEIYQRLGIRGAGQSSWGPTVHGFVDDAAKAESIATRLRDLLGELDTDVLVVRPKNTGASLVVEEERT